MFFFFLKRVMNSKSVDHNIAHKEQEPPADPVMKEGWRNVGGMLRPPGTPARSGREGGEWGREVNKEGRGGEGRLSGLRSASHAGSASSRRCCCRCCC